MNYPLFRFTAVVLLLFLCGCASTPAQMGKDTYMVSHMGSILTTESALREECLRDAQEFCASRNLVMVLVSTSGHDAVPFVKAASCEVVFRAVKPEEAEAQRPAAVQAPTQAVEVKSPTAADNKAEAGGSGDLYTELMKLDDLRKRGLISDAEFEAQKQKLLNRSR